MKNLYKLSLALILLVVSVCGPIACGASESMVAQSPASAIGAAKTASALSISTTALPAGVDRNEYLAVVEARGGTPGYTWAISSGNLPSGLVLVPSTGLITGTPKQAGTSAFTLTVSDKGKPMQTVTKTFSITTLVPLAITTSALSSAVSESTYSTTLQASGGAAPYTWSISSGSLPSGLTLDAVSGRIAGTPRVIGASTFSVAVTDHGTLVQNTSKLLSITTLARLAITTSVLSSAVTGSAYAATLQETGGVPPYTWSISSGSLPSGLTLNPASGAITGTPTGNGTSTFITTVTDQGNPTQSVAQAAAIAVIPQLSVPSVALPAATTGITYAAKMQVNGGVPAYTWSIASGSLPAGLSMAGTTGIISGTPNAAGTFNFAAKVVDNGSPTQAITLRASIKVNAAPVTAAIQAGTTWYVRADGGTRYSPYATNGQCDGKADAPYSGVGTNQHCAFNDYRFLWDDQAQYGVTKWVIAGGDTVILDNKTQWRVGFDVSSGGDPRWCRGGSGTYGCTNPPIPAGTAAQHTRILGRNWATCHNGHVADRTQMTQIFGGHGVYTPMNLGSTQYVDLQCLEITRHSQCVVGGLPTPAGVPSCTTADDYDSDGIEEDAGTANVTMTDLWVHNHPGRGVKGPIGGPIVATNVTLGYNESAGWDFDDGNSTPFGAGASWTFNYSTIEWSGCYQEYPIVHANPALACYGQSNQGYGDGVGTAPGQELDVAIDHSTFRYNTQDGEDFGHVDGGMHSFSITNSLSYGNNGAAFKWGWGFTNIVFENNVAVANCRRMSVPMVGTPSTYNTNLGDFCRSGDALSFNFEDGTKALFANNTIITYAGVTFDEQCVPIGGQGQRNCSNAVFTLKNNLVRGYSNPAYDYGGNYAPATFCGNGCNNSTLPIGTINRDHNMWYGFRGTCIADTQTPGSSSGSSTNETCGDPMFTGEPASFTTEAALDGYILDLTSGSPARGTGTTVQGLTTDYMGVTYATPPSMGALEYKADEVVSTSTAIQ